MKTLIVYYSRGGSTEKVAKQIAKNLAADAEPIKCLKSYSGFIGYFKAGHDSFRGRLPPIAPTTHSPEAYDLVVIGAPMWAGHAATPVRSYLQQHSGAIKRVAFFMTSGGSSPDKAFQEMAALAGRDSEADLGIRSKAIAANKYADDVAAFVEQIRTKLAT